VTFVSSTTQRARGCEPPSPKAAFGFDIERPPTAAECGLLNMNERAEGVGRAFVLHSVPDRGTTIAVDLPLNA
jgi:hypothetical protein